MTASSRKSWPRSRSLADRLRRGGVLPTKRLIGFVLAGALVSAIGYVVNLGLYLFWAYNALLVVFSLFDFLLLPKREALRFSRQLPERVDLGKPFEVHIGIGYSGAQPLHIHVRDDIPYSFDAANGRHVYIGGNTEGNSVEKRPERATESIPEGSASSRRATERTVCYETRATHRGDYIFEYVYVRVSGFLGLWSKQHAYYVQQKVKVQPDLSAVRGYLSALQDHLILNGKRVYKKVSTGTDFHHIREYSPDDDPRMINWAGTARSQTLMSNVYRPERGKAVTILIDCGRLMGVELDGQTKLDRSLEAALVLAAVVLKQGDQVSAVAFSADIKVYVPPGKGMAHFQTLLEALSALQHDETESDYGRTFAYLNKRQKRRSLMVLYSDMENYLFEETLVPYFSRLRRRHMLLLLSLEDPLLWEWRKANVRNSRVAYIQSMAYKFGVDRKRYVQKMADIGIQVVDVPVGQFSLSAVNAYFSLKAKGAL